MLGRVIADPDGLEGPAGDTEGLGLLILRPSCVPINPAICIPHCSSGLQVDGYEIIWARQTGRIARVLCHD